MKPDWSDSPSWANYLAQDEDGEWFWSAVNPTHENDGIWYSDWQAHLAQCHRNMRDTLEERPVHNEAEGK
jgi:hypothetical protein